MRFALAPIVALWLASGAAHAQGVTDAQVVLGQSAALSGPAEELGKDMQLGASLYFNQVNATGGVNGRRIVLKSLDDGHDPVRAAENTRRLVGEEKVFALFGYVGSPASEAALPILTQAGVPFVGPVAGSDLLRAPMNRLVFNMRAGYREETEAIVEHLTATGVDRIAVFHQDDAFGRGGLAGVERALARRRLAVVGQASVPPNSIDVANAVAQVRRSGPQAVVMVAAYKSCAAFVRQMSSAGPSPTFWTVSSVGSQALARELGEEGRGVHVAQVVPYPWDSSVPVVREYRALLAEARAEPGFGTLEGFIAAKVVAEGLRRAGRELTREGFIRAMESLAPYDVGGYLVRYGPGNRSGSGFVDLTILSKDGRFVR